jgi:hypothetical protein
VGTRLLLPFVDGLHCELVAHTTPILLDLHLLPLSRLGKCFVREKYIARYGKDISLSEDAIAR